MGLQQSKDELLYQQVGYGASEAIKKLHSEGAGLEWTDKEGKTPLILASMNPQFYDAAKTLLELGANVNAYRPGRHAGTPLHHAAKRGLEPMVKLLLSHGANALVMNDACQTAIDIARDKGYHKVVRAIESHICLFSGWLQEIYGPGFLELLAPQLLSRKVWVVILPCGARELTKPFKLELAIYTSLQDAKPRSIIALWKANMDEPNFNQPDPAVIISSSHIPKRWRRKRSILRSQVRQSRIKLTSVNANEKQQLQMFCNACKGIPQVIHPALPLNNQPYVGPPPTQTTSEDTELALQSSSAVRPTAPISYTGSTSLTSQTPTQTRKKQMEEEIHKAGTSTGYHPYTDTNTYSQIIPTAPPMPDMVDDGGPVCYPPIDSNFTPVDDLSEIKTEGTNEKSKGDCVICLDAPVEGACIPCGHMAGCMSCLTEIKVKNFGCPVCRAKIDQVVRLYAV